MGELAARHSAVYARCAAALHAAVAPAYGTYFYIFSGYVCRFRCWKGEVQRTERRWEQPPIAASHSASHRLSGAGSGRAARAGGPSPRGSLSLVSISHVLPLAVLSEPVLMSDVSVQVRIKCGLYPTDVH